MVEDFQLAPAISLAYSHVPLLRVLLLKEDTL